jgi:hypothetical protein
VLDECWLAGLGNLGSRGRDPDEEIGRRRFADTEKFRQ